jgi:exopolysaccharide biosynthesis polyprenyl glycosylphosphotransferase
MLNTKDVLPTEVSEQISDRITLKLGLAERKLLLRTIDILAIGLGMLSAIYYGRAESNQDWTWSIFSYHSISLTFLSVSWLLWLFVNNLYESKPASKALQTVTRIGVGVIFLEFIYALYLMLTTPDANVDTLASGGLIPSLSIITTGVLLSIWRYTYALMSGGVNSKNRILIVGAGKAGVILAESLKLNPHYEAVGFIDDRPNLHGKYIVDVPVINSREVLKSPSDIDFVDEIVFAIDDPVDDELLGLFTACNEMGITVTPMSILYEQLTGKVAVEHIGCQWYAALPLKRNQFERFNLLLKRILDLFCSIIIGFVFVVLLPFVALAIKLDSPGPIFYFQERVGLYGRKFTVCKFRSMVQDAEQGGKAQWAVKGDNRITSVGRFIRKTRLDELPQVVNVLRGEMSMVGPRPEREQFIVDLQKQIPFYRMRLSAKPGLTGWAQINYGYGSTVEDALIKLQYDLYYLKHRSLWLDLKILLRTFAVVLNMRGQ